MHTTVKTLTAACASALLLACSGIPPGKPAPPGRSSVSADEAYALARQQHLASRLPAAIDSYQAALRADPHHLNAANGLATLYAEQGNLPKAIGIWRELTVDAADSPATAFIHSNLGYAYLLNGDFQLAIASLERACVLDPLNHRAWRHLGDALASSGQDERAARMHRQADSLERHDARHDYALLGKPASPAVTDIDGALAATAAVSTPMARATDLPATELHQIGNAMFELRRPAPLAARHPVVLPVANKGDEEAGEAPLRLEISNGNGVSGMARALSGAIADRRTRVVRLSNQKGFGVERTRVEYQRGFGEAAARLAEHFGGAAVEVAAEAGKVAAVDVRLVLGRDLARSKSDARRVIRAALNRTARRG